MVITGPHADSLAALTRVLLDERLCACGQLTRDVRSQFRWEGQVNEETEARVALHTRVEMVDAIVARVRALHPYDVPCVLALPVVGGDPGYLAWVHEVTGSAP